MPHEDVSPSARISILLGLLPSAERASAGYERERRIDRGERSGCTRFSVVFA